MSCLFSKATFTIHISIDVSWQYWLNERWRFIFLITVTKLKMYLKVVFFTYEWKISENYMQLPFYASVLYLFIAVNCIKC